METGIDALRDQALARRLDHAEAGDIDSCFDLGMACSTGSGGMPIDLIEAHKWFNLAAAGGHERAGECRGEVAEEMTARQIVEAQRRARLLLQSRMRLAA